jgi:hypothetical protein
MSFDYKKYMAAGGVEGYLLTENTLGALAKAFQGKPLADEDKQALSSPVSALDLVTNAKLHNILPKLPELVKKYDVKFIPHKKPFKGVEPLHVALFLKYFKGPGLMKTEDLKGKWIYIEDDTFKKQIPSTAQQQGLDQGQLDAALQMLKK